MMLIKGLKSKVVELVEVDLRSIYLNMSYHFILPNDIHMIESIHLEVSSDSKKYRILRKIDNSEFVSNPDQSQSTLEFLVNLLNSGRSVCEEKKYKSFRLKISLESNQFYIYDAEEIALRKTTAIPEKEKSRYGMLSNLERKVLCFIYRGYDQNAIAFVFQRSVEYVNKLQMNIYRKTGFVDNRDLENWCDKYLRSVFKMTA